ncbi:glycosyltransferase family 4 protein [Chryseobacterium sp. MFBS3-17]|uniref:glycosyltransferase family 4 protein n=1 Tax=Chryseobacterium sp. MFBS3-17 TaxID=2886689 RepID=UPI001D0F29B2|nr:glycosyltransferase family 4 protein [Chryseobacterium sp. MFBS3-17]MCC2591382.1 glycosyltransferase family 4 protein [Chryseobacterium sp. MFBS3-17]
MKILIPLVGSFSKEGGWRVLSELANKWMDFNHEVIFLSHKKLKPPYYPTKARIIYYDNSGNVVTEGDEDYPAPIGGPFILRILLRKALNKLEADVVLATQHFTADPVAKSTIKAKKFYYVQAYEPDFYNSGPLRYKIYKQIAKNSYKKGLNIIVNAPMYKNYKEIISDKVVYPGLDMELFYSNSKGITDREVFILGTIGRMEIFKGTHIILEAFSKLRLQLGSSIELHIAFGDENWSNIDGVTMHFPKGDRELAEYYRSLDCYVCAQYIQLDAVHYPIIESMACGVPVITTGYYPSNEYNSWQIEIKNVQSIVDKVMDLQSNKELVLEKVERGLHSIKEFEWSLLARKMINYFKE